MLLRTLKILSRCQGVATKLFSLERFSKREALRVRKERRRPERLPSGGRVLGEPQHDLRPHQSPAGLLFNETNPHPKGSDFRNQFLNVVQSLAINDINRFNSNTLPNRFDSGDGDQQDANENSYPAQFSRSPSFSRAVQGRLTTMGSTLTPAQIVQRSLAMSCAGCHQLSNGRNLGGGLVWPASLQFVHVSEAQPESGPNGQRFRISQALTNVFLPHRQQVFEAFLNGTGSP